MAAPPAAAATAVLPRPARLRTSARRVCGPLPLARAPGQSRQIASRASVAPLPLLCQDAREALRGDVETAQPSLELIVVDGAVAVRVELGEELLHELLIILGIVLDRRDGLRGREAEVVGALELLLDRTDEGLGGETRRAAQVARAFAGDHAAVHALAQPRREDLRLAALLLPCEHRRMVHRAQECLGHAERVHGGLLATQVRRPHIGHRAVRGLVLFDHGAVREPLADEVGGDEAGAAVHLRDLVGEHVAVIVVRRHAEAAIGPPDDLHRCRVGDQMGELASALVEQPCREVLLLVVRVEGLLHRRPEALLPLKDGLLGHDVRRHLRLEAAREEVVREVGHVVQRVVVGDHGILAVAQLALVDDHRSAAVVGTEDRGHAALADGLVACAVLASDGMPFEEHRVLVAELHAFDVDRVSRDCDPVPAAAHGAVGRAPRLLETEQLLLHLGGRDCRLLEDGADARPRVHRVVQALVLRVVTRDAREVVKLPRADVDVRPDPLLEDQIHSVLGHLLAADVHHRRRRDLLRHTRQRPHGEIAGLQQRARQRGGCPPQQRHDSPAC
mmetsp:Transcript_44335/g.106524  ORF Transcript_44335/g.106524 Transcript_44335/m.106524 type:complete len:561 (-) Transcript_44335:17-1699(-)